MWRRRSRPAPGLAPRPAIAAPVPGGVYPPRARLTVATGRASPPVVDVPAGGLILGRNISSLIILDDPQSSRHHARIEFAGGAWVITDLGSSNGTYINGVRINRQALRSGDQIGQTVLVFRVD